MKRAFVGYYVPKGAPRTIAYAFEARAIGRIELNPAGGGFVRAISVEELDEKFDALTPEEVAKSPWEKATFSMDDDDSPKINGYTNGRRWNGWAIPYVSWEALRDMIPAWNEYFNVDGVEDDDQLTWYEVEEITEGIGGQRVWIIEQYDGERHRSRKEAIPVVVDDEELELYDISDGLTWHQEGDWD
jgi:hypothetical protein